MSDFTPPADPTGPAEPQGWEFYAQQYPAAASEGTYTWQSYAQLYPAAAGEAAQPAASWQSYARDIPAPAAPAEPEGWQSYAQQYPAAASEGTYTWQSYAQLYPAAASEPQAWAPPTPASQAPAAASPYADVVSAGPPPPSSKRGVLVGVGALALALLAGGGIYIASQSDSAESGAPESVIPASAFAFAKIDLDPATDQKVAIHEFSKKFPKGPKTTSSDPMAGILTEVFKDESGKCTYEQDVKPWLGKRIGIAAVAGASGKTVPLIAMQVTDEAAAKAALAKTTSGECAGDSDTGELKGFAIKDGYGLLSNTQADVDAAVKASDAKTLSAADNFSADIATLEGNQVVTMWADLSRAYSAIAAQAPADFANLPATITQQFKGRMVLGLHMENDVAEITGKTLGGDVSAITTGTADSLKGLPEKTVMALTAVGFQKQFETQLETMRASGMPVDDMLSQVASQLGIDVRTELLPMFGNSTTIALGNVPTSPLDVKFGMKNLVDDPAAAQLTANKIAQLAKSAGIELDAAVEDKTLYLTTGGYAAELRAPGNLGQLPAFQKAMGDLGDQVSAAFYIDISQLTSMLGDDAEDLAHLSAFGVSSGKSGDDGYFRMRLVVK
jgi:hypothetical protein